MLLEVFSNLKDSLILSLHQPPLPLRGRFLAAESRCNQEMAQETLCSLLAAAPGAQGH